MSNYRPSKTVLIEFDGDNIAAVIDSVSFEDALSMRDDGNNAVKIAKKYVRKISGLRDADGEAIDVETVFREFYFSPLVYELTVAVLATGTIRKAEEIPFGEK